MTKLTPKQREIMAEFDDDPTVWVSCGPDDRRSVEALKRKGLIIVQERVQGWCEIHKVDAGK